VRGIERLLDLAHEQLDDPERRRLRATITARYGDWEIIARGTAVHNPAERLVGQLADADAELAPDEVRQLEARVYERLPDSS
jgi:hypothetical protein